MTGTLTRGHLGLSDTDADSHVVLVGATDGRGDPSSYSARITRNLMHSTVGRLSMVNPKRGSIHGVRTYATLFEAVERYGSPNLVVLAISRQAVMDELDALAAVHPGSVLIIASGFSSEEREGLGTWSRQSGIRVFGPNCVGFALPIPGHYPIALQQRPRPAPPHAKAPGIVIISQSGGSGTSLWNLISAHGIPVTGVYTTGDEVDVGLEDLLELVLKDKPGMVCLFIETIRRPARFRRAVRSARAAGTAVAAIKVGESTQARTMAQSHTGALVGEREEFVAAFEGDGGILCESMAELADVARLCHAGRAHGPGTGIAVLSSSGGSAALAADAALRSGLDLPPLATATDSDKDPTRQGATRLSNPCDSGQFGGTRAVLSDFFRAGEATPDVGAIVIGLTGATYDEVFAADIIGHSRSHGTRTAVVWPGKRQYISDLLAAEGIFPFEDFSQCCTAIAKVAASALAPFLAGTADRLELPPISSADGRVQGTYVAARQVLKGVAIRLAEGFEVSCAADAAEHADQQDFRTPWIAKTNSGGIAHKAAVGGVVADIRSATAMIDAYRTIAAKLGPSVIFEREIAPSEDLLVSVRRTPFGQMFTVGQHDDGRGQAPILATFTEPVQEGQARARHVLWRSTLAERWRRSGLPVEVVWRALVAVMDSLSGLLAADHTISEVEINPLRLTPMPDEEVEAIALDAKVWRRDRDGSAGHPETADAVDVSASTGTEPERTQTPMAAAESDSTQHRGAEL